MLKEEFKSILDKTIGLEGGVDKDLKFIISEPQESYGKPEIDANLIEKRPIANNKEIKRKRNYKMEIWDEKGSKTKNN